MKKRTVIFCAGFCVFFVGAVKAMEQNLLPVASADASVVISASLSDCAEVSAVTINGVPATSRSSVSFGLFDNSLGVQIADRLVSLSAQDLCHRAHEYYVGLGGTKKDKKLATYVYELAAEKGSVVARCNTGFCYDTGTGVEKNEHKAIEYYGLAVKRDDAIACYNLALCYAYAKGVAADHQKAFFFLKRAAEKGHAQAAFALGICYFCGLGVRSDAKMAAKWFYTIKKNPERSRLARVHKMVLSAILPVKKCLVCRNPRIPKVHMLSALLMPKDTKRLKLLFDWIQKNSCSSCVSKF